MPACAILVPLYLSTELSSEMPKQQSFTRGRDWGRQVFSSHKSYKEGAGVQVLQVSQLQPRFEFDTLLRYGRIGLCLFLYGCFHVSLAQSRQKLLLFAAKMVYLYFKT